ncbi:MAG: TatD family hydrolase [Candidatus Aenigmarchaeota archaeon]|nr:TatD family hydrolase [Candidatus Aenigmarchaeota archaeon]
MIDIHAHLCFPQFEKEIDKVVERAKEEIDGVIVSSASFDEGKKVLELVKKYPGFLFATLGYHPTEGTDYEGVLNLIEQNHDKIVGVGEAGLDYHWEEDLKKRDQQKLIFVKFISAAERYRLPLVIHSWDAEPDCFNMVNSRKISCIFHCYSGSIDLAKSIIERGFYISMSTQICFSKHHRKLIKSIPLENLLLETDSPFLGPERHTNMPWNIKLSADKIATEKGISKESVLTAAKENAIKAFNLKLG